MLYYILYVNVIKMLFWLTIYLQWFEWNNFTVSQNRILIFYVCKIWDKTMLLASKLKQKKSNTQSFENRTTVIVFVLIRNIWVPIC